MIILSCLGLIFSIVLLVYNKGCKSANVYLGLFLFLFDFITITHFYIYNNSKVILACLYSAPIKL